MSADLARAERFAARFGLRLPVLMAPMAGASPVALAAAVADAGGMGALGALLMEPPAIADWVAAYRRAGDRPLQINLWVPDPPPARDAAHEAALRAFLARHGPPVAAEAGDARPPDFAAQCEALLAARPTAASSIMGLFPERVVQRLKDAGIAWFANVTTLGEARAAAAAGADVIVAQGAEAGGHRGAFDAARARDEAVGLFALLPQVVDAVDVPVVATGGIADARGVAAALLLGASAVQLGTALLRTPEAGVAPCWAAALATLVPEATRLTRAFSGRWGRAIATDYVRAAAAPDAPPPAPYPVQRGLTAAMRQAAEAAGDLRHLQAWAGQAAALAHADSPRVTLPRLWADARNLLAGGASEAA
ncbi:nitronate monooxygenase [Calidifontimicrobium sp. SYSU G02091]|uniref:NAD(P)H-dependent flavin oxidoreductase n=1 Tax=Calidifontimicrobium sp. SYSU G02091 TaxID=2926421 RepID=UPI001F53CBD2|nr:nitronate monooxygenase [Calidifontimicrobium sp. SYSU G02091]